MKVNSLLENDELFWAFSDGIKLNVSLIAHRSSLSRASPASAVKTSKSFSFLLFFHCVSNPHFLGLLRLLLFELSLVLRNE